MSRGVISQLREARSSLLSCDCQFFACPGPYVEHTDMATCCRCSALQHVRNAMALAQGKPIPKLRKYDPNKMSCQEG